MEETKVYLLFTASGPILVLTEYNLARDPESLKKLAAKTSHKFVAFEANLESVKTQYKEHFSHIMADPKQATDIKVLDHDGKQIFRNVSFKELSAPVFYDP